MKTLFGYRLISVMMAMFLCVVMTGAAFAEGNTRVLGNEKAGYITVEGRYYDYITSGIDAEVLEKAPETTGYCQYICMEGPCSGMIVTLSGYHYIDLNPTGTLDETVNMLANDMLSYCDEQVFVEMDYQVYPTRVSDDMSVVLLLMRENNPEVEYITLYGVIPFDQEGHVGYYFFENVPLTEEAYMHVIEIIMSAHF